MYEVAVDVGGTFADFVVRDRQGHVVTAKVSSNLGNSLEPIRQGLSELAGQLHCSLKEFLQQTEKFIHGTTVGINALLQGQGAKTALITTEGFRDAIELRRSQLTEQWDFRVKLPPVLVPRYLRIGLRERMDYRGVSLREVDLEQIEEIARYLHQEKVEAVAVCLLFACRNSAHEAEFKKYLQRILPEVFVTLSSDLSSHLGEYERTTTTVLNARLSPILSNYLHDLKAYLRDNGLKVPISIAQNNGGLTDLAQAGRRAVHTLFSGPAGGVKGGWALAREQQISELVVGDMGGTSFDVSLIRKGEIEVTPQAVIAGYPVQLPMLDIHTIGAGGGSIAWIDQGGMLRVGPHSAGAKPGPACYGLGGKKATITDAALVMGLLDKSSFLGGRMALDEKLAYEVIEKTIAVPLGLSVPEAAYAIYQVALSLMVDAVYLMTVQKGYDPRRFSLAAVGGALPIFAAELAKGVGIRQVVIPELSPVFCAQGLHYARFQHEVMSSLYTVLGEIPDAHWYQVVQELELQANQELFRLGVAADQRDNVWSADLKYPDQHHEITVAIKESVTNLEVWKHLAIGFHETHQKLYGYSQPEKPIVLVNLRLLALEKESCPEKRAELVTGTENLTIQEVQPVYWQGSFQEVKILHWQDADIGMILNGPVLIKKTFTTIFLDECCQAEIDGKRNLIITIN
ncbi:N-methylhydantoinase A/acetone carboxylase, beta subunit [Desulfosporosinus orientis DSM 765]|uniref:N-methylhydantoinase A/acetone carboxylase, beta subunit n=1 Tax=Desulfosporosinus orientis (strain ATCC 19365 / DSM 765 / NCIMB 8382 / VKM B-1628 / Singapore I) TaxID=768706 RepID=G7WFU8_DESOD|nr:hydantoinase/oxoprolinase family protein [Desulfosporosinus orientis]AET69463.1 N-methylhydantoinase A/acetone carboxylase, beta subunit [Desulfosporosinus orientis DSM 765]